MLKTEALINTCVNKPFSEDHTSTLLDFMGDLGLRGWPFQKDTKTLADVWRAASSLLRQLGLATLVSESDSIFIPMAMFDPSYMIDSESMLLQVPRVATKIIGVLFKGIHHHNIPSDKVKWSLDTELGYHDVLKCLQKHYGNTKNNEKLRTQITAELSILDSMAILPAFKLFLKKVNKVNIEDYGVLTGLNITVKQLFFILYAKGLCETMDSKREKEVPDFLGLLE
ncbi:hypothetical protein IscW_ISCW004839 [Ixodes scapularis]|uniref:Uncharacterized protein n=1 Tax=Ixodes scapularis TaxID=6945 RepID=B7PFQ3_IXOSC|nr:hypothetical protein IscW_ISCW004839 [Ixodes scapularis]|eukprot:XP_002434025.1 hypothetical protein IscW_ISCW004839 [Ixodes scapularis]